MFMVSVLLYGIMIGLITLLFDETGSVWTTLLFVVPSALVWILTSARKKGLDEEDITLYYLVGFPVGMSIMLLIVIGIYNIPPPSP